MQRLSKKDVLLEIEMLRKELNDQYKKQACITPELVSLSVQLDQLLNKLRLHP
ncbi:aspartyl-phosphate phosphatase Spo0E family protein [Brevibacillus formosus]|uniref:Sporulation protein Spo0E n=1 Tax=Brevibacillus formosus TaxID=54913 RepID=A0A837KFF1_9BACL|nr:MULTISPECIES: aspartyl-phosphate phosphatase Spo0E family protein [Brevibacillus]KLH95852.1 sporulation protein Spo0E [Brevibacillus formosus]MBG9942288.1 sporulation protein Spo0E [Brevibacillus formosus]MBW5471261.1 Spo0E family sporulation regulatory protein-aspartic acid phosphatase [Brevibacillus formosus]MED1948722.1 aspartyl-phosphate phosphatase Spo0E family protein [Brevibacillus formosus]MED1955145.1 aspartyl-phosphate phosphatase Spo0E family protein [Brevibacillus formosus]